MSATGLSVGFSVLPPGLYVGRHVPYRMPRPNPSVSVAPPLLDGHVLHVPPSLYFPVGLWWWRRSRRNAVVSSGGPDVRADVCPGMAWPYCPVGPAPPALNSPVRPRWRWQVRRNLPMIFGRVAIDGNMVAGGFDVHAMVL